MSSLTDDTLAIGARRADERARRNAVKGAFFSEFVDLFDIYLPVVALAPVLFYFQPTDVGAETEAILASLVFITTLLGRPVGALIFGTVADRLGRRTASLWSIGGFAVVTFLIALLPGYGDIGIASYLLLILLRFVDGIFLGGGYTGAIPLAFESSRKRDRGFVGGLILAAFPASYVAINLMVMAVFALFPLHGPGSPYVQVGWRLPFVAGAAMAGVLFLYYKFKVSESDVWRAKAEGPRQAPPFGSLLRGRSGRDMLQVLLMMSGFWLTQNVISIVVPTTLLRQVLKLSSFEVTTTLLLANGIMVFTYLGAGLVGQRIGRRRFFLTVAPLIATLGPALLYLLAAAEGAPLSIVVPLVCLVSVLVTAPWGVIATYINERFATGVRATGFGAAYSLSVVLPSFYAFYMSGLGSLMPYRFTPLVLLCLGGILATVGAALGPETRDVDL